MKYEGFKVTFTSLFQVVMKLKISAVRKREFGVK